MQNKISINELKLLHKGHFFDDETMIFFNSKIESENAILINDGYVFITSEKQDQAKRRYTVRSADRKSGSIETIGSFQQYLTKKSAQKAIDNF